MRKRFPALLFGLSFCVGITNAAQTLIYCGGNTATATTAAGYNPTPTVAGTATCPAYPVPAGNVITSVVVGIEGAMESPAGDGTFTYNFTLTNFASVTALQEVIVATGNVASSFTWGSLPSGPLPSICISPSALVGSTLSADVATCAVQASGTARALFPAFTVTANSFWSAGSAGLPAAGLLPNGAETFNVSVLYNFVPLPIPNCPVITTPWEQGVPIIPVAATASSGVLPYTSFSATGLPPGLTMSSSGTISGTPTASGTFNPTITVTDSAGNTGTVTCPVTVYPPLTVTCPVINALLGVPITPVQVPVSGGTGSYTFSATGLPPSLTISTSGLISGTVTGAGTFNPTITVTDSAGGSATVSCSITVGKPAIPCPVIIHPWEQGVLIIPVTLTASGGAGPPYTFSATGLPPGLTVSSSGIISGTPTANGTFPVILTVTDSAGNTGTATCPIPVAPPLTVSCPVVVFGSGGSFTSGPPPVSGGVPPYTFLATGLPPGSTISPSSGVISGTLTVVGTFFYTITVTDSAGGSATANCSITIGPPTVPCPSISAVLNVPITPITVYASGGAGIPYTFSAAGLPPLLTMSLSGTVSGTPTVLGTFPYTITVTDSAGNTGTASCSVPVVPIDPPATCFFVSYAANLTVGESYVNIINTGAAGAPLLGPGLGAPVGNICVNVYAFDPEEEEVSCCSCLLTPNQVANLGVNRDLISKTLTGVMPSSVVIKLVCTLAGGDGTGTNCNQNAAVQGFQTPSLAAFGTTVQPAGTKYSVVEHLFVPSTLSTSEYASITGRCASIMGNGSGYGICQSCQLGAMGAAKQ